jgi:hypothetical protein
MEMGFTYDFYVNRWRMQRWRSSNQEGRAFLMSYSVLCIWITYHNNILASLQAFNVKTPPKLPKLPTNVTVVIDIFEGPTYNPTVRESDSPIVRRSDSPIVRQSDKCFISLKVNTITCVIWSQKPNRLLTKERSRTSETRYHRRTNNWQGYTRTKKNPHIWTTRTP